MSWTARFLNRLFRSREAAPPAEPQPLSTISTEKLKALQAALGYRIRQKNVFIQALQHRSYHQRSHHPSRSNERLEFLGDSILNFIVGEHLFERYPSAQEGELTKLRSRLVNKNALSAYAGRLKLADFILMSPSAAQAGGKGRDTIAADTFEAIVAAIYLDGGYDAAREFVRRQLRDAIETGLVVTQDQNFKSRLLEYAQSQGQGVPRYILVNQEGPDHDRTFTVDVVISGTRRGTGSGKNKKEAEQAAAYQAIQSLAPHAKA
jgi:ribonuclease-3